MSMKKACLGHDSHLEVVHGTQRCSEDGTMWLQVQNLYLPMKVEMGQGQAEGAGWAKMDKNTFPSHFTGWLIGITIMDYENQW